MQFTAEVLRRKVREGTELGPMNFIIANVSNSLIPLPMSTLPRQGSFVCNRCIQHLSRRHVSTDSSSANSNSKQHATTRNNGVTGEETRFRKVKIEEPELKAKWSTSNIIVGKEPRLVPIATPLVRRHLSFGIDPSNAEVPLEAPRPAGRVRAGRARIPGPKAVAYLKSKEQPAGYLVPSAPSAQLGSWKETEVKKAANEKPVIPIARTPSGHDFNWYWETRQPTYPEKVRADHFFLKNRNPPTLLRSVARFMEVPESDVPEVAFVGRSNVGKSSLLNAIVDANVKDLLARTSATRGFTKTMNFYGIGPGTGVTLKKDENGRDKITGTGIVLVDMPGYGDGSLLSWGIEIMKYIQARKQLRRVFVLLDAEHGIKDKDRSLLASLRLAGVSHQVILSKMDKIYVPAVQNKKSNKVKSRGTVDALRKKMEGLREDINPPVGGGALGEILACSSETLVDGRKLGLDHVRYAVLKAAGLERTPEKKPVVRKVGAAV